LSNLGKKEILGVQFDDLSLEDAVETALGKVDQRAADYVVTPNPEIVIEAGKNPQLKEALENSCLTLADGIGIIYSAKILGTPLQGRVTGIDFATALMKTLGSRNGSVYLLGAKPGVAEKAAENLQNDFEGLRVVGMHDGYFDDDAEIIADINQKKPDFLMVCLGFPKQEIWMNQNKSILDVGIMAGLGGCMDVFAGVAERAPESMQKLGLEWLYRLYKDPVRIKRMIKLPKVLFSAMKVRIGG